MKQFLKFLVLMCVAVLFLVGSTNTVEAKASPGCKIAKDGVLECEVANSHYTGWDTWTYADEAGLLAKWGQKFGVRIKMTMMNTYGAAIDQYTGGNVAGVTITNMDLLIAPGTGGIESDVVVVGDYSNGNDAVLARGANKLADIVGRVIVMMQNSVSDFMFSRGVEIEGRRYVEFNIQNTDENAIVGAYESNKNIVGVTWNPHVLTLRGIPGTNVLFDSSMIPGEILDLLVIRTDAPEALKKAMAGAWYEMMAVMYGGGKAQRDARAVMARSAGCTLEEYERQLQTTFMYDTPAKAVTFTESDKLKETTRFVSEFCFKKGLLGIGAKSAGAIGISFPDGKVYGDPTKIKIHYTTKYMKMARDGQL